MDLAIELFWESQMLIQTTAESELDNALIIQGFEARVILLKIYICWMAFVTISEEIGCLVSSTK